MSENATRDAALSGGLSGTILGGASALVENADKKRLLKRMLLGGLGGAGLAGSSIGLGHKMLGEPDDAGSYTRSGAVGGATIGSGVGALGSYLLSKKILNPKLKDGLVKKFTDLSPTKATASGAVGGGLFGAYQGSDEGMQLDFIGNEIYRKQQQEQLEKEQLLRRMGL